MKMKKLIYSLLILTAPALYAQNVVYKCVDSSGNTSYINSNIANKNSACQKTNLADPAKSMGMLIRNEGGDSSNKNISNVSMTSGGSGNIPVIKSDEQKKKDEGRFTILSRELQDEQEQLANVEKMIKNLGDSKDIDQISKLKEMQNRHIKNITALKKELGIKVEASLILK